MYTFIANRSGVHQCDFNYGLGNLCTTDFASWGSQVGWRRSGLLPQTLYISHRNLWQVNADEEHQWSERNHADQPVDQAQDCDGVHIEGGGEGIDRTARTMNVLCKIVNK